MKNLIKSLIVAIPFIATSVCALPVTGEMEMTGGFHLVDAGGNTVSSAAAATGVDFDFFGFDKFRATSGDGDFSGLAGSVGDISDFQFESFVSIANFWTIGVFSFELTSVVRGFTNDPANFLVLNGAGTISANGFDDTAANWLFTGDASGGGLLSWSATPTIPVPTSTVIPEPGVLALLSIGLIGFGLRKKIS
jgi:hypothetical protein